MAISDADVLHVARLARLRLDPDEVGRDARAALDDPRRMCRSSRSSTWAMSSRRRTRSTSANSVRADRSRPSWPRDDVLRGAPDPGGRRLQGAADGMIDTAGLTAERCVELLDAREVSCRELVTAYLDRIDREDPALHAFLRTRRDAALCRGRCARPRRPLGARGRADRAQGHPLHEGRGDDGRLAHPRGPRPDLRRRLREPGEGRRADLARQDEHGRVRDGLVDRELGVRRHPQPLGSRARAGRARRAARRRRSRPGSRRSRSAPTRAARSASPRPCAASSGMKPTYGAVSRYGLIAFASSLDQIGPFALTVRDCALLLQVICGKDELRRDVGRASRSRSPSPTRPICAVCGSACRPTCSRRASSRACARRSTRACAPPRASAPTSSRSSLPHAGYALPAYYIIAPAEASANLSRFDGVRYGLRARGGRRHGRRHVRTHPRGRLRRRGEAPDHARHLRALGRLLRRVLRDGAEGANAHPRGLRRGVRRPAT